MISQTDGPLSDDELKLARELARAGTKDIGRLSDDGFRASALVARDIAYSRPALYGGGFGIEDEHEDPCVMRVGLKEKGYQILRELVA